MTTLTPEQFMTQRPDPPEDEQEPGSDPSAGWALPTDPLTSIAGSLSELVAMGRRHAEEETQEDRYREAFDDLEAKHQVLLELVEDISEIVKPSTSKLANSVREAIARWTSPSEDSGSSDPGPQPEDEPAGDPAPPADDAPIEAWLAYAEALGLEIDPGRTNRSQIRSMLGLPHPSQDGTAPAGP